jgi:type I restriction enzyme S subunit
MSSDLEWVALGEMIEYQKGYAFSSEEYSDTGCPIVRVSDFTADSINHQTEKAISPSLAQAYLRFALEEGDIVIATVGSWGTNPNSVVGKTIRVPKEVKGSLLNQNAVRIRARNKKSQDFLFYSLKVKSFSDYIVACAQGSANQASITLSDIFRYEIADFSPDEHRAIAAILRCIDDKIELNRKTNETLEAMAKALFKSWFVDFDPVRAKAEGRPTGLPGEISDLFPDSFEDSELGEIPSGWKVEQLGEVIELAYGKPLKEEERNGGVYTVFGSNGVVGSHDEYLVEAPGIVVGRKGNPGTVEWSDKNFYPIDTTFFIVKKKLDLGMRFLFYSLKNQNLANLSADSAVPGLNRNHAYMNNQLLPPVEVASAFECLLEVIFKRKGFLAEEINTLGATRDALLPKLISGEIRIPDAEKMLEEVGV